MLPTVRVGPVSLSSSFPLEMFWICFEQVEIFNSADFVQNLKISDGATSSHFHMVCGICLLYRN
jgi:hypothetical protein